MAVARDGRKIVTGSFDGCIRVWDTRRRDRGRGLSGAAAKVGASSSRSVQILHSRPVSSISVSVDGQFLASGSWDKQIRLWQVSNGSCVHVLLGHAHVVTVLSFSGDSSLFVSGSRDESVRLWNTRTGACENVMLGHRGSITALAISRDGSCIVSGSEDRTVRLWKAENNYASSQPVKCYEVPVVSVALSWNGTIAVAVSGNGICNLWDVSQYPAHAPKCVASVTFTGLRFGPSTASAALGAYSQKRGLAPETRVTESISVLGLVSSPVKNGLGLRVSWPARSAGNNSSSSSSFEEFPEEFMASPPSDAIASDARPMASTFAYFENAIGKESCLWTPVFSNSSGRKFLAAGLCTGAVAILEVLE
jgi:WD40 repeat protein